MGDGGPLAGSGLVARKGLTRVWNTPSLEAAGLGQVHVQTGDRDQSLVREITRRAVSEKLQVVAMCGREEADAEGGKRSVGVSRQERNSRGGALGVAAWKEQKGVMEPLRPVCLLFFLKKKSLVCF